MEVRRLILLLLGCVLALGGCRSTQHVALLEQELRLQEDRIYQLQDCLQETRVALDACCQENESLRRSLANGQGGTSRGGESEKLTVPGDLKIEIPSASQSQERMPEGFSAGATSSGPSADSLVPGGTLKVTPGVEGPSSLLESQPEEVARPDASGAVDPPRPQEGPTIDVVGRSKEAKRIEVGELAIGRIAGRQSAAGDEGLSLVVVPRDGRGAPLPAPSPISVVVVDPAVSGPAGRVARWDFTPEQVAALYESSESGEGFRLRLKWPGQGPAHKELHLFVRYETADGRKLHAEVPFDLGRLAVAAPRRDGSSSASWQRKAQPAPREQAGPAPRISGGSTSLSEAPAWRASAMEGTLTEAPPWNGPSADTPRLDASGPRIPQRVTARPKPPTWSPERD